MKSEGSITPKWRGQRGQEIECDHQETERRGRKGEGAHAELCRMKRSEKKEEKRMGHSL